ncbi:hypothetical protein ACFQ1S_12900, partial [Kibdelosporangium lantanae]
MAVSAASISGNVRVLPKGGLLPDLTLPSLTTTGSTMTPTCTYYGQPGVSGWQQWVQVQVPGATIPTGSVAVAPGEWLRTVLPNAGNIQSLPLCHDIPPVVLKDLPQVKVLDGNAVKRCQLQLAEDLAHEQDQLGQLYRALFLKALLEQSAFKASAALVGQQKKTDIAQLIRQSTLQPGDLFNAMAQATQQLDEASRQQAYRVAGCTPSSSDSSAGKTNKATKDPRNPDELRQQAKDEHWSANPPRTFGQMIKNALEKLAKVFKGSFRRVTLARIISDARLSQRNAAIAALEASQQFGAAGRSVGGVAATTAG